MDKLESSGRRERKDMVRNLERVLEAAHELFAERGSDVTIEEVARRAGVGIGTVYRRFPSKDILYAAVSNAACAHTCSSLRAATAAAPDPVAKLRAIVIVQYRRCEQQAALLEMRVEGSSCEMPSEHQLYSALHEMLQAVIADSQRLGLIGPGEPGMLAALCLEMLTPHAFQRLSRSIGGGPDAIADHVVRFMLRGLGAR